MSLMRMSLAGGAMVLLALVLRPLLINRLPKRAFLCLWWLALLRLLAPFSIPWRLSFFRLAAPFRAAAPISPLARPTPAVERGAPPAFASPLPAPATAAEAPSPAPFHLNWRLAAYLAGAVALALLLLLAYLRLRRFLKGAVPVSSGWAADFIAAQPLRRKIALATLNDLPSPLTFGLLRPVILLPHGMLSAPHDQLRLILLHEITHVRRFDAPLKLLPALALCLHWFNPLVWLLYFFYSRDVELACDEKVLRMLGPELRPAYASLLLSLQSRPARFVPLVNGFGRQAVRERIVSIMKYKKRTPLALLLAAALVLFVASAFATSAPAETANEGDAIAHSSPWSHILLLGADRQAGGDTDAIVILSVHAGDGRLKAVTLHPDLMAPLGGRAQPVALSSLAQSGGAGLLTDTLGPLLGLDFEGYLMIDFPGLIQIVDMLDGVDIDITQEEMEAINRGLGSAAKSAGCDQQWFEANRWHLELSAYGPQIRLSGMQALAYCRIRSVGSGDWMRMERSVNLINALLKRACENEQLFPQLLPYMFHQVNTSLPLDRCLSWGAALLDRGVNALTSTWRLPSTSIDCVDETRGGVAGLYDCDFEKAAQLYQAFLQDDSL